MENIITDWAALLHIMEIQSKFPQPTLEYVSLLHSLKVNGITGFLLLFENSMKNE